MSNRYSLYILYDFSGRNQWPSWSIVQGQRQSPSNGGKRCKTRVMFTVYYRPLMWCIPTHQSLLSTRVERHRRVRQDPVAFLRSRITSGCNCGVISDTGAAELFTQDEHHQPAITPLRWILQLNLSADDRIPPLKYSRALALPLWLSLSLNVLAARLFAISMGRTPFGVGSCKTRLLPEPLPLSPSSSVHITHVHGQWFTGREHGSSTRV